MKAKKEETKDVAPEATGGVTLTAEEVKGVIGALEGLQDNVSGNPAAMLSIKGALAVLRK